MSAIIAHLKILIENGCNCRDNILAR